ncbi:MAG: TIM barrel protein [Verrucomicrobiota bacterium]
MYLYVEGWDDKESQAAVGEGFTLALHQRLFKPVHRLEQAEAILQAHPSLRFLPETAHLTIAGDSPADAVAKWAARLAAIHLKDWTPIYGRSSHRYARGFVQLGTGIVSMDRLFERLREIRYSGWLVFEQANSDAKPEEVVAHATRWLSAKCGTLARRPCIAARTTTSRASRSNLSYSSSRPTSVSPAIHAVDEKEFLEAIIKTAVEYSHSCYPALAEGVGKLLKARLVMLCACSPAADVISVVGVYPQDTKIGDYFANYRGSLSSVAVERQAVTTFDLQQAQPAAKYAQPQARLCYRELVSRLSLRKLISVPVQDPQDPRQIRIVLNIFPADQNSPFPEEYLARVGRLVLQAADAALDERCALAAANVSVRAGQCQQADAFLAELRDLLLDVLHCETLTIFLVNDAGDRLEGAKSTGLRWDVPAEGQFYRLGEGLTGKVWQRKEALLSRDPDHEVGAAHKSDEARSAKRPTFLCAPMMDVTGVVVGVVRCQNKRGEKGSFHMFSEDDLAVLDAVSQAAVPHLQVLLSKERRAKALRRLTHELNHPLVAIRGAAERMRNELVRRRGTAETYFSEAFVLSMLT